MTQQSFELNKALDRAAEKIKSGVITDSIATTDGTIVFLRYPSGVVQIINDNKQVTHFDKPLADRLLNFLRDTQSGTYNP